MKEIVHLRNKIKAKKPTFLRQKVKAKISLASVWRRPKGLQSKLRLCLKGHRKTTSQGYRSPTKVRGLDRNGLNPVVVSTLKELETIRPKEDSVIIRGTVGKRKKVVLLAEALKRNLVVLGVKDIKKAMDAINNEVKERTGARKDREKAKAEEQKKEEKKEEKKETKEEKTDEEKALKDKQEKDKLLRTTQ